MKIAGEATLTAPVEQVWDALLDPAVLVRTIPGCERLEATADNTYDMTVTAGVASIRGTYAGTCRLSDLTPHESLKMNLQGAGAPGTVGADVAVRFEGNADGTTTLFYDADAVVGGMVGGVGQRMLTSVSRRMAAEFFGNVEKAMAAGPEQPAAAEGAGAPAVTGGAAAAGGGAVFTAPAKPSPFAGAGSQQDFLRGVAVGAGLVLAGVVVGGIFGRRS
jgi:carbon monoxide dehydrogenase subunit G